jgi:hypothetical protein
MSGELIKVCEEGRFGAVSAAVKGRTFPRKIDSP